MSTFQSMTTGNPVLGGDVFADWARADRRTSAMTVPGTALKTLILLAIACLTAGFAWGQVAEGSGSSIGLLVGGGIGGLIFALATTFKPTWAPFTAPLYAACEGLVLGAFSVMFEEKYQGIVFDTVALTFGVMFLMLVLYATRLVRVTGPLVTGIMAATGAVALTYLASLILGLFGVSIPFIHGNGLFGIGFSFVVVAIAAFNLLLDFDAIERGARAEAPKYMEWYGAFGLMVTLVWLYLEILRLLSKLRSRD